MMGAVAIDVIVGTRAAVGGIGQGDAARLKRKMRAAGALQVDVIAGAVATGDQIDRVAVQAFARGALEIRDIGRVQGDAVVETVAQIEDLDAAGILAAGSEINTARDRQAVDAASAFLAVTEAIELTDTIARLPEV